MSKGLADANRPDDLFRILHEYTSCDLACGRVRQAVPTRPASPCSEEERQKDATVKCSD